MGILVVDTNVFLRYLLNDNPIQAEKINQLFLSTRESGVKLLTTTFVVNEVIWTLESYYQLDKKEAVEKAELIVGFPGIKIRDYFSLKPALAIYKQKNVDLVDIFTFQAAKKFQALVLSYDRDFDKLDAKIRQEP